MSKDNRNTSGISTRYDQQDAKEQRSIGKVSLGFFLNHTCAICGKSKEDNLTILDALEFYKLGARMLTKQAKDAKRIAKGITTPLWSLRDFSGFINKAYSTMTKIMQFTAEKDKPIPVAYGEGCKSNCRLYKLADLQIWWKRYGR